MKVKQIAPNQIYIHDENGNTFFQSYDSIIAKQDKKGKITLDAKKWNFSKTTAKYRNSFCGMDTAEIKKAIAKNVVKLENLNKVQS
jgi:hypothetical protein